MPAFSIIVPVYNRPDEVRELLQSLTDQTFTDFEVIIVEDGSSLICADVVELFTDLLTITYYSKPNGGQGFARNYGFERANGDWLVVFDSDCLIPPHYFQSVLDYIKLHKIDAWGGPDRAHASFSDVQKAINFSMTSFITTGGIRGNRTHIGPYHPRSFNMGISRQVWEKTGGYILPKKGEDIEFSIRIIQAGFKTALIPEAYVFHKRRTDYRQFFRQLHFFGTARINIYRFFPQELKWVHWFPALFTLGMMTTVVGLLFMPKMFAYFAGLYGLYTVALLLDALRTTRSFKVALMGMFAAYTQLIAYGLGFLQEGLRYLRKG